MQSIRTNHELRLRAFDTLLQMKNENLSRQFIISEIHNKFGISIGTLYDWYREKRLPYGRKGTIMHRPELFYVLGALLGDGCLYRWKTTNNYIILVGDKEFTSKYAKIVTLCTGVKNKAYIIRSKNVYFVRSNNFKLYDIFQKSRTIKYLENLLLLNKRQSSLYFLEGFFDAEGCVKIIKEKARLLPKICLDITNTNLEFLELYKKILKKSLDIEARYSIQEPSGNRKTTYHLRIYKKENIRKFFENIKTTKLKEEKIIYVKNWLKLEDNSPLLSSS